LKLLRIQFRNEYVKNVFSNLDDELIENVKHFDFEGDEWYLVIPRYKEYNDIVSTVSDEKQTVYKGEAFTVRCNISDLYSNVEIVADSHGGHKFSPQLGGDGRLIASDDVWDITDYNLHK